MKNFFRILIVLVLTSLAQTAFAVDEDMDKDGFTNRVDCDDLDYRRHPGAVEICFNGIDENCDGIVDNCDEAPRCGDGIVQAGEECDDGNTIDTDGCSTACTKLPCDEGTGENCIIDEDRDGYGTEIDCDDGNPRVHPDTPETCNDGIDNDCNGLTDNEEAACKPRLILKKIDKNNWPRKNPRPLWEWYRERLMPPKPVF